MTKGVDNGVKQFRIAVQATEEDDGNLAINYLVVSQNAVLASTGPIKNAVENIAQYVKTLAFTQKIVCSIRV